MTLGAEDDAPLALVEAAGEFFEQAAKRMAAAIVQLETGRPAQMQTAQRAIRELRLAVWLLVDERARLDRLRNGGAGPVGDGERDGERDGDGRQLDLDAARDEIGRRLAGLRAAGNGG